MNKKIVSLGIVAFMFIFTISSISAMTSHFSYTVPTMQGYSTIGPTAKSNSSNFGVVRLSTLGADAVTFSAMAAGQSYGNGTTVYQTGMNYNVNYRTSYAAGVRMTARFRNHNWSLNSPRIVGYFNFN